MYELLKKFEGFSKDAYKCPAGQWTIGYGSTTYVDGSLVQPGDRITPEEADELVNWYCTHKIIYPKGDFSASQKEALCSLIYNIGQGNFNRSTLKKCIEKQDWANARKQWMRWVRANGKVLKGLVNRREAECELFFTNT
jgi:lysozyme